MTREGQATSRSPGCQGEDRTPRRERFLRNLSHKGSQQPGV